ncbi:efflux RND transporter periplasmic adaptor subunit [Macromonas nakdongensis]|uniref:efflux RND transporter periplasmic adaptor subunit n=1 Tax=Macromonas nakdongensis TaxID=1843082 RepID=UPI000C32D829|nr:efflux RND transporter periplasmic adaptor subunit [Macromonas nakdongensis]
MSNTASIHSLVQEDRSRAESAAWAHFTAPTHAGDFTNSWLGILCAQIHLAQGALLLLRATDGADDGSYLAAAVWPDASRPMQYLVPAATKALRDQAGTVVAQDGVSPPNRGQAVHIAYPIEVSGVLFGAVVVHLSPCADAELQQALRLVHWGTAWLVDHFRQQQQALQQQRFDRLTLVADALATAMEAPLLAHSATAVVNMLASRLQCDRVSLGLDRDGEAEVLVISHTATFDRRTNLVRLLGDAMDEVLDLDLTMVYPPPDGDELGLLAHAALAREAQVAAICSVPLVSEGQALGVVTFERTAGPPFDAAATDVCRALGLALGPVVALKQSSERSVVQRLIERGQEAQRVLFGPRHPGAKLIALSLCLVLLVFSVVSGDYRVSARTVVEGAVQRAAVAPFNGYVVESLVRAGDTVRRGQVLARLDDKDLLLEQTRWSAELQQLQGKQRQAMAVQDRAAWMQAQAQAQQARAQLSLVQGRLERASLTAPFDGIVVSGDLSQLLGTPVEQGKVLFEVAPLDAYRVILEVDERDIADLSPGQRGDMVLSGLPGQALPFTVKQITPVTSTQDGRNLFRVEAQVDAASDRLRPGMEGVGKVGVGERRLIWIWTHGLMDWLRLAFWNWMP